MAGDEVDFAALVRRVYDAYNAHDLETLLALADPDLEFSTYITSVAGETYRGHEGVRRWWQDLHDTIADPHVEVDDVVVVAPGVGYVVGTGSGRGRASDMPLTWPVFQVGVWSGGHCTVFRFCPDREAAEAAARELAAGIRA